MNRSVVHALPVIFVLLPFFDYQYHISRGTVGDCGGWGAVSNIKMPRCMCQVSVDGPTLKDTCP